MERGKDFPLSDYQKTAAVFKYLKNCDSAYHLRRRLSGLRFFEEYYK